MQIYFNPFYQEYGSTTKLELSKFFIKRLKQKGFDVEEKLGEGVANLALKAKNVNGYEYVLLVNKNRDCKEDVSENENKNYVMIRDMQRKGEINYNYVVAVYDSLLLNNVRLNDTTEYCLGFYPKNLIVQIQELIRETLIQRLIIAKSFSDIDRDKFRIDVITRIREMIDYFLEKDLIHFDMHFNNMGFIEPGNINTLVFIDIESIMTLKQSNLNHLDINNKIMSIMEQINEILK